MNQIATKGNKRTYWQLEYWQTHYGGYWDTMQGWHFHDEKTACIVLEQKRKKEPEFHWRIVRHDIEIIGEHLPKT